MTRGVGSELTGFRDSRTTATMDKPDRVDGIGWSACSDAERPRRASSD